MKLIYFFVLALVFVNCSEDNSCEQADWVGTYIKISEDCDNGGMSSFEESIFFEAGPCDNCLADNSRTDLVFNDDCVIIQMSSLFGEAITELDGDIINASLPLFNCSATYRKQ